jgi:hypothetical protein
MMGRVRAMREWAVLLVAAATAWPAWAAKTVSVQELDDLLASLHGKPDAKVAQQISDLQVTERISFARLARWEKESPGEHTHLELIKLADQSAFLNPPAADVLRDPEPDADTQGRIQSEAVNYVKTTLRQLPNFYATRETTHFEDSPSQQTVSGGPSQGGSGWRAMRTGIMEIGRSDYKSLHSTGSFSAKVTYRDGLEVNDEDAAKPGTPDPAPAGLQTKGEFGPILSVVLGDALRGSMTWLRWEEGPNEPVAVFGYSIPEDQSNYMVMIPNGAQLEHIYSAYHGEIAIDPEAGQVLRVSVVADLPPPHESMQTATMVEYGPVSIGDQSYICPVRGVAYSKVPVEKNAAEPHSGTIMVQTQVNDVAFIDYHLFKSDARIVANDSGKEPATRPGANAAPAAAAPEPASAAPDPASAGPSKPN